MLMFGFLHRNGESESVLRNSTCKGDASKHRNTQNLRPQLQGIFHTRNSEGHHKHYDVHAKGWSNSPPPPFLQEPWLNI